MRNLPRSGTVLPRAVLRVLPALLLLVASLSACGSDGAMAPTGVSASVAAGGQPPAGGDSPDGTSGSGAARRACTGPATAVASAEINPVVEKAEPVLPATVTDVRGKQVTITDASRILAVDVSGTLGTTVYALGLGDRLVGRDVSTGVPALAHLPLVTVNGHELNGEAILDLTPSVVLTDYGIGPLEVQLQLEESGIPVVFLNNYSGKDSIGPQIRAVADALGVSDLGAQLADRVAGDVLAAEAHVASLAPKDGEARLRMAFLYMRGTSGVYSWFGKGSGADDLIRALGGVDVAGEVGVVSSRPLNAEGLVKADPDMFLMMTKGLSSVGGIEGLQKVPGVADTVAGRTGCVVDMADHQILSFGPMYPATLRALADSIYTRAAPADTKAPPA